MQYFNVSTKRTFTGRDGVEKTTWLSVGTMRQSDDGKMFLELNMFPNTSFYVFQQEQKETSQVKPATPVRQAQNLETIEYPDDENINPDDIPF